MTLESGTFISDLNVNYPESNVRANGGDNHLRWIKTAIKNTFPNVSGAITPTHTVINDAIAAVEAATNANTANTLVKRDSSGNFNAGTITAAFVGNLTGNTSGTHTGPVVGDVAGDTTGTHTGPVIGNTVGTHTGPVVGYLPLTGGTLTGNISFGTNDKAIFGAGNDLQIYHDGSHSRIVENGTGDLRIYGDALQLNSWTTAENYLTAATNGAVNIYYDGSAKLATTTAGIDVTGTVSADGLTVSNSSLQVKLEEADGTYNPRLVTYFDSSGTHLQHTWSSGAANLIFEAGGAEGSGKERMRIDGATGDISFYEDTGTTPKLFWDASAESLGIGTSSPESPLHVAGDIRLDNTSYLRSETSSGGAVRMLGINASNVAYVGAIDSGATSTIFNASSTSNTASFYTAGSEKMRIDSSGNVGIGTSSPYVKTEIVGGDFAIGGGAGSNQLGLEVRGTALQAIPSAQVRGYIATGDSTIGVAGDLLIAPRTSVAASVRFITGTSPAERLRIDSSGRVGIGTTSPATALDVRKSTGDLAYFIPTTSGHGSTYISSSSNKAEIGTGLASTEFSVRSKGSGGFLTFDTSGTERARIDSSGNLLVGKTSASSTDIGCQLLPTGGIYSVRDGNLAAVFDRKTSDGELVQFRKDGTAVGSMGTRANYIKIGNGDTNLLFNSASDAVTPEGASDNRDAGIDLGRSVSRFKDLYLSGEVKGNAQTASALTSSGETNLLLKAYPVGAIYISTVSTSPSSLFGGTWVSFGAGRVLVGLNPNESEFNSSEATGGAKTHTLTAAQSGLPAHSHTQRGGGFNGSVGIEPGSTLTTNLGSTGTTGGTNAAEAHNNLQPYIVVYMFKRTA